MLFRQNPDDRTARLDVAFAAVHAAALYAPKAAAANTMLADAESLAAQIGLLKSAVLISSADKDKRLVAARALAAKNVMMTSNGIIRFFRSDRQREILMHDHLSPDLGGYLGVIERPVRRLVGESELAG